MFDEYEDDWFDGDPLPEVWEQQDDWYDYDPLSDLSQELVNRFAQFD